MRREQANTPKEVIFAMIWLYENRLEWTREASYRDYEDEILPSHIFSAEQLCSACLSGCLGLILASSQLIRVNAADIIRRTCGLSMVTWNDAHARNKQDVISMLRKAYKNA